jgi:hypothetical protein
MKQEIKLGDKIKDNVTGLIGIAVARTKFLNGCIQYAIATPVKKGDKPPIEGDIGIDEMNLKVIKKNVVNSSEYPKKEIIKKPKKSNGGATRIGVKLRGY